MRGITKNFDAVVALNNASLKTNGGQIMALLGSNGSGKSTIVKVLSGLVNPNSGDILFEDKPVRIRNARDARRLGIAIAYQDLSLIPAMSVIDNIVLGIEPKASLGLVNRKKATQIAHEYLQLLKIDCDPNALVQTLMPSVQSMIEIAKALATNPKLLILDEATASLHSDEVDTLFEVLEKKRAEGLSIIIVTHRMGEIYRICDACTILRGGETVFEGAIEGLSLDEVVYHMTGKWPETTEAGEEDERAASTEKLLEVKNLNAPPFVRDVSFYTGKGEIVGIGGLDGQGQSEFIRMLLADQKYQSGEIVYAGESVHFKTPADAVQKNMGFISGDRSRESIFPLRSVAENIFAANAAKGSMFAPLTPKQVNGFAADAVDKYGIVAGSLAHPANSLSGGNQQKLVVARWIALSPDLLILDDPTKGVDIAARREIHAILKQCTADGMSVIYVSSDNEELLEISDRIYVFYEGAISAELVGAARKEERLVAAMLGLTGKENPEEGNANA